MATLLYQGHGSLRMTTDGGKVIYIDPFAGEGYDLPADLILVTHPHHDHNCIDLPAKNQGCVIWQSFDAQKGDEYQTLNLDFASVRAVEAYNHHHKKSECVGYIVTADGISIYFAGATGETRADGGDVGSEARLLRSADGLDLHNGHPRDDALRRADRGEALDSGAYVAREAV